jgi:8-oxo-dGTP pyrophosphatase MutT (NUDIX family)
VRAACRCCVRQLAAGAATDSRAPARVAAVGRVRAHDARPERQRGRCASSSSACAAAPGSHDTTSRALAPAAAHAAVVIFTVLRRAGEAPHTLLVKQFRPPVRAFYPACRGHVVVLCPRPALVMTSHVPCCVPPAPQMAAMTLELPAGLIDAGETPAVAALRELKEETGYTATVRSHFRTHARTAATQSLTPLSRRCAACRRLRACRPA